MAPGRVLVVGAGLGGIATALRLAVRGHSVTLLERGERIGGKMNRWQRDGYTFDTGPSLITMPEVFAELFSLAGADIHRQLQLRRLDPVASYRFADGSSFRYGQSLPLLQAELQREFPYDIEGFHRLMALGGRLFELSRRTFFADTPGEPPDPSMAGALKYMPLRHGWGNYDATVRSFVRDERLISFFGRYATYVGSSPYQAPATLLAIPYLEYAHGAWYFQGGLYSLVEALHALLLQYGVEIRCGASVSRIIQRNGGVAAVSLEDGMELDGDIVIFNGDSARLPMLLGESESPAEDRRSMSGFVMLLGIDGKLPTQPHHSVYFSDNYSLEFDQLNGITNGGPGFPEDPTVYVNMPSASDNTLAPPDCESLFIMANCPADDDWNEEKTQRARRLVLQRLQRSGFPDITDRIRVEQLWTPACISSAYDMPGGAIYGQDSHGWRNTFLRPANRHRRVRGLYRVGGSSHPGGGTPTVLLSAAIVDRLVERYEGA
ncbi:MAG: phytoene desaturase [Planctomycetales bacterium]|nr:phytoene desaturase [bacterium]UNM06987.1 MAG: phytoene desaturase [Planctomycetales bacterium]